MRRLLPFAATLLLAGCATAPRPEPETRPAVPAPAPVRTNLSGLSEAELVQRFGPVAFRVREGVGLKLQWQNATCVLDTYLYPPVRGTGAASVTHADARRPGSGETVAVEGCVASLATK
jgi:outer membrane biogenesis lipoprotein LolB